MDILRKNIANFTCVILFVVFFISSPAQAATLNVVSGCTLADAINSINLASDQGSCLSTGTYGVNDIITLPASTELLTADLPTITEDVIIQGSGISQTIIDGDNGQFKGIVSSSDSITIGIEDITITGFLDYAIFTNGPSVTLSNIEIDGANALSSGGDTFGIYLANQFSSVPNTIDGSNIYVHNVNISTGANGHFHSLAVDQNGGGTTTANFSGTTISDIHNNDGGATGFVLSIGSFGYGTGGGTLNATTINTTVDDLSAATGAYAFGSIGIAQAQEVNVNSSITNVTVTGIRGAEGVLGNLSTGLFNAGVAFGTEEAIVQTTIQNSLLADNSSESVANNCLAGNYNSMVSATGPVNSTMISDGHNLSDDGSCAAFVQGGDQQNVSGLVSTLGPLQNNGGETPTRALLSGSPAIAAGVSVLGITIDQRGVARSSSNPSVGAYEYDGEIPVTTTTPNTSVTTNTTSTGNISGISSGTLPVTGTEYRITILYGLIIMNLGLLFIIASKRKTKINF